VDVRTEEKRGGGGEDYLRHVIDHDQEFLAENMQAVTIFGRI